MVRLGRCIIGQEISRITQRNQWRLSFDDDALHQYTLEVREILTMVTMRKFMYSRCHLTEVCNSTPLTHTCWFFGSLARSNLLTMQLRGFEALCGRRATTEAT